ncbi:MAG: efflux RND transporter periplasmic adaptor subunit [Holophagales bacterium]|nr:efflux RND transporter periplasmic adaptor subunit [Holophagales bacterium]
MSPKRIVPVVVVLAVAGFAVWKLVLAPREAGNGLAASGTVEATDARLGFEVPGRLLEVAVREGERVAAGAPLARLDQVELGARRVQAEAQTEAARAKLQELEAGFRREEVAQGKAAAAAAADRVTDAERDLERTRTLYEGRAVPREALDKAELAVELARRQREQADEQLALLSRGARPEQIAAARAQVAQAEAAVATLDAAIAKTRLEAPFDGLVTVRHREPGEIVAPGSPVVTLMNPDDRWVRIYVPENRLGRVALGQRAEIVSDTFPGKRYEGEVAYVSDEAEFTPKNVQTTEERVRLVYAVKVRITGDAALELKPGLPADVTLEETP